MIAIHAPVQLADGTWVAVRFQPGAAEAEPFTSPDQSVVFRNTTNNRDDTGTHFEHLKAKACELLPNARESILAACPSVTLVRSNGNPLPTQVTLSTTRDRSWELAYLLATLTVAGRFDERWNYWATGSIEGDHIIADSLDQKFQFALGEPGRVCLLAPSRPVGAPELPPDKLVVSVDTLGALLHDKASPLAFDAADISRFSLVGAPPILARFATPETFDTRSTTAVELAAVLRNERKRLILLTSPLGWGKTTVLTRALRLAQVPTLVVPLENVTTFREAIDALLAGLRARDEADVEAIDTNPWEFTTLLRRFVPGALLVFVNGNVTTAERVSPEAGKLILALLDEGFRCVVECWTQDDWEHHGRFPTGAIEIIPTTRLPRLAAPEVASWVSRHGNLTPDVVSAFAVLDGHPLGINVTLAGVLIDVDMHLPATPDSVLEHAVEWVERRDVKTYIQRIELLIGKELSPRLLEWFTLFWPHAIPDTLVSPAERRQLRQGVRLGLVSFDGGAYRAYGWFHLFCRSRLRQGSSDPRELSVALAMLDLNERAALARVRRRVVELEAELPAYAAALERLAGNIHTRENAVATTTFEYVAPVSPETLARISIGGDLKLRIWALEQACRSLDAAESGRRWADVLSNREALAETIQSDWTSLRSIVRAYRLSASIEALSSERALQLLEALIGIDLTKGPGHASYSATLSLELARDLGRAGLKARARDALAHAAAAAAALRKPARDEFHYPFWTQLQYRLHRRRYQFAATHAEALELLGTIASLAEPELAGEAFGLSWQRRYLWAIGEAIVITGGKLWPGISTDSVAACDSSLLTSFLLDHMWLFDLDKDQSSGEEPAEPMPLADLPQTTWRKHGHRLQDSTSSSEFLTLMAGVLCRAPAAITAANAVLAQAWAAKSSEIESHPTEYVRLTTLCLRLDEGRLREAGLKITELTREKIVRSCASCGRRDAGRLWTAYMKFAAGRIVRRAAENPPKAISDLSTLFSHGAEQLPELAVEILATHYDYTTRVWQVMRRHPQYRSKTDRGPKDLSRIVEEMVRREPGHPVTLRYVARYAWYVWDFAKAYESLEAALQVAATARRRRQILTDLTELLTQRVLTPPILRTANTPELPAELAVRLGQVASELHSLYHDRPELAIIADSLNRDEAYWQHCVEIVQGRLGRPGEFWARVASSVPVTDTEEPWMHDVVDDLTDPDAMRLVASVFTWASELPDFSAQTREELIMTALASICAAQRWNTNVKGANPLATDFRLATTISLALRYSKNGELFGTIDSPFLSKTKGKRLTWRAAADAKFQSVMSRATGTFREHAREIAKRLATH